MSDDFRNRADLEATLVEINSLDPHDEWHLEYCGSDLFSVANLDNEWMTDGTFEQVNIRLVYLLRGMEAMTFVKCGINELRGI